MTGGGRVDQVAHQAPDLVAQERLQRAPVWILLALAAAPEADLGTHALQLAAWGWHVFPVQPRGKAPLIAGGRGYKDATTDPTQIQAWWAAWPDANIGVWPGASGGMVLDFDTYRPGYAGAALLQQLLDEYPTVTDLSGSGSPRLWYRMPEGQRYGNHRGRLPRGIDVRAQNGYVVAAPSVHPNGRRYRWMAGRAPG